MIFLPSKNLFRLYAGWSCASAEARKKKTTQKILRFMAADYATVAT